MTSSVALIQYVLQPKGGDVRAERVQGRHVDLVIPTYPVAMWHTLSNGEQTRRRFDRSHTCPAATSWDWSKERLIVNLRHWDSIPLIPARYPGPGQNHPDSPFVIPRREFPVMEGTHLQRLGGGGEISM